MKLAYLFILLPAFFIIVDSCKPAEVNNPRESDEVIANMPYDSALAQKLGADEYGMKNYVMAFLKTGSHVETDTVKAEVIMRGHFDNIKRMADEGKLVLAGPFLDAGDLRGIYIFNVSSLDEAKALTESDPAVKAGVFVMELHPWYGSAAACMINEEHEKIAKKKI